MLVVELELMMLENSIFELGEKLFIRTVEYSVKTSKVKSKIRLVGV